jgi:protein O-mannosyl-transferase
MMSISIGGTRRSAIQTWEMRSKKFWTVAGICAGLIALVWFVLGQAARFPFINFDDPEYVYEVPEINSGLSWHNMAWAFTHWPATNWFPLKNISLMLDFQLFGFNPGAFHLTNVVLHGATAVLLFLTLWQLTQSLWKSTLVAALFAIHPLRVESVVWIEERKDVLSGVFFILTLGAFFYYARKPSIARYLAMSILFAAGLLSKPMLVTTPVILLLLDYWPLERMRSAKREGRSSNLRALVLEKIPLLAMSVIVAFLASRGIAPAHSAADQLPFFGRVENGLVSYLVYIWETIWPVKLGLFYPFPPNGLPLWQPILAAAILLTITIAAFAVRRSCPYFFVGWFWYVVMLLPVIGIIQVNLQAHADRYTYLPQIGLLIAITWTVADLFRTSNTERRTKNVERATPHSTLDVGRWTLGVCCVAIVGALALAARVQASYWRDSETLWRRTIAVTKHNYFAQASLADLLMRRGLVGEAIQHSEEALRIRPADADAQNNLGLALLQTGDLKGATAHLQKALEVDPGHMNAEINLAWILATAPDDSMRDGQKAVQLAEDVANRAGHPNVIVLRTLAAAYAETGQFSDAIAAAEGAIQIAKATGNNALASDLENNIAAYRVNQPLRSGR